MTDQSEATVVDGVNHGAILKGARVGLILKPTV